MLESHGQVEYDNGKHFGKKELVLKKMRWTLSTFYVKGAFNQVGGEG